MTDEQQLDEYDAYVEAVEDSRNDNKRVKAFFDPDTNNLVAWAFTLSEYESACDALCSGFREESAIVRDITVRELKSLRGGKWIDYESAAGKGEA